MNLEEQRAHYATIKDRLSGRVPVQKKNPHSTRMSDEDRFEKERAHIASLANGLPNMPRDLKASIVCLLRAYDVFWTEVTGRCRTRRISHCRRAIIWLLHLRGWSLPRTSELINCDHTSCCHALDKANSWARNLKKGTKKATREWNGEYTPVPQLRGNLTKDIEAILEKNKTTWTHIIIKADLPEVILARREIVLYLHEKEWGPAKIAKLVNMYDSGTSRIIKKYGKQK